MDLVDNLTAKEKVVLCNLYLSKDYPHNFVMLKDVCKLIDCSKATAMKTMDSLAEKKLVNKQKGYINFYEPVNDRRIKNFALSLMGLNV